MTFSYTCTTSSHIRGQRKKKSSDSSWSASPSAPCRVPWALASVLPSPPSLAEMLRQFCARGRERGGPSIRCFCRYAPPLATDRADGRTAARGSEHASRGLRRVIIHGGPQGEDGGLEASRYERAAAGLPRRPPFQTAALAIGEKWLYWGGRNPARRGRVDGRLKRVSERDWHR